MGGGILQDCGFDDFYGSSGAGSGVWKIFKISGSAGIGLHPADAWPVGPSLWIQSANKPFDVGVYQQAGVTPGTGYQFVLQYAVISLDGKGWNSSNQVNRRVGFDPFGGSDPNSPNVKWSPDYFDKGKVQEDIQINEYARAQTITVFIRVANPYDDKHVDVFIDSPYLVVNAGMAPIAVTLPSPTAPPATTAPPTTARPTRAAVVPTPTPASKQTAVSTATITPTETALPEPTATRLSTRVRRATPTIQNQEPNQPSTTTTDLILIGVGVVLVLGLGVAGILFALAFWHWRR